MLSIQFGASVAKGLFFSLGPAGTTALRVTFSALLLLLVANPWRQRRVYQAILSQPQTLISIAAYGVSLGLMNLFFYFALQRIPLGLAVTLEFVGPLAVSVYYSRKWRDLVWVFLAAAGIVLLFIKGQQMHLDLIGMSLAIVAGVFWGLYIIFGKKVSHQNHASLVVISLGMSFAALVTLPVGLGLNFNSVMDPQYWWAGLGVAVLSSAVPYSLELKAMRFISEKTFGILMSFEPVIALIIGFIFLHESMMGHQIVAILLVVVACIGSSYDVSK